MCQKPQALAMSVMNEVFEEFNQQFGTDSEFQLKAMEPKEK